MKFIDFEEIEIFHNKIIIKTGGSPGIRDRGLIESALNKPFQTFDGKDLYISAVDKISAVTYSLISNHGFIDGNKKIGVSVMLLLLKLNDIEMKYSQKDLVSLGLGVASGKLNEANIIEWINKNMVKKA